MIGKADVDIADMVLRLGNSDWVKQGIPYYKINENVCPFCQQKTPASLATSLEGYFDESFVRDTTAIATLQTNYLLQGERILQTLDRVLAANSRFLDSAALQAEKHLFEARLQSNRQRLDQKVKEPSQSVALEPLGEVLQTLRSLLATANHAIREHNLMVENLAAEQAQLIADVWAFFAHSEATTEFARYQREKRGLTTAIESLERQIVEARTKRREKEKELRNLERQTTSVRPTVDAINLLLQSYGFKGFSLKATENKLYQLYRADGSDAKETLSEGERSFITFLYFYHLLRGSISESGITTDRIAVFDDPVSSLDSDVLFIVGSLIRQVIEDVREKRGHIKQVFLLTHNVYFHKEVTFHKKRQAGKAFKEETFWVIRKVAGRSTLRCSTENPIKTSYDLLWAEIRESHPQSPGVQNAMRRIIEHYFCILGGMPEEEIIDRLRRRGKLIRKALFSWVNDGSHSIPDDLFLTFDDGAVEKHKTVFKDIFVKTRHLNHYNMMMQGGTIIESMQMLA